jgi:transcriptional regulator with XRE-family HTH domain
MKFRVTRAGNFPRDREVSNLAYPNLSAELRRYGITQEQMAERIGRKPETVSRWMNGKNSMPVCECFRIREELFPTMSVDYLFASEPMGSTK